MEVYTPGKGVCVECNTEHFPGRVYRAANKVINLWWDGIAINDGGPLKYPSLVIYWVRPLFIDIRLWRWAFSAGAGWWAFPAIAP